jgi:hypothetical protein
VIDSKENILRLIGGEYVSAALKALLDCETATEDLQESVIDVPNLRKVRFTCRRVKSKHHKSVNIFWNAIAAIKVE